MTKSTAASEARGILINKNGMVKTAPIKKIPCETAAIFVFPQDVTFAEVLTITEVMGIPPIKQLNMFPTPCAFNSLFVLV